MSKQTKKNEVEEFQFQAEMSQLLHLITHSLYSHREIFLRELISNASDALNKIHFSSLTNDKILGDDPELKIQIQFDEKKKTFSITDNGIGMTHDELIKNIGTIASSGTSEFIKQITGDKNKDMELIGKFGVGFYSVFMVADEVSVESRSFDDKKAYKWTSAGTGSFSIEPIEKDKRGTTISFKFNKDSQEFASKFKIESIIKKYSDFVSFPIELNEEITNKSTALWARDKKEIKKEDYIEFYKYISNAYDEPLSWQHFNVEAPVQFKSILFIPKEPDRQLFNQNLDTKIMLYVKRVFIQNDCKDLLPQWLRFVHGVVDSEDLSLNVSRETTQKSPVMDKISKYLVKKLIAEFQKWAEKDQDKYASFWKEFGNFIKEGIHTDFSNKDKLIELYRCYSSESPDKLISLMDYKNRMGVDQEEIYFVCGKNKDIIENSPNIEYFRKNKIEVLYLFDEIDDFIMPSIGTYQKKKLVGIDKAEIKISESEENKKDALGKADQEKLLGYIKDILGEKVEDVIESKRLVDSACTLVSPKDEMNANMEKMMKMMDKNYQGSKRVMEINSSNSLIKNLSSIQNKSPQDPLLKDCIEQLYEGARLLEGSLNDPSRLVPRTNQIMQKATDLYLKSIGS
ncbi:MAG: molecular chaperone HtpG [Deltaproteobacteria bacterium]|nr:molecular chaperone HtpG [Deltaproteobacteria bacterium]